MRRIYVAGPYTAKTPEQVLANVNAAMDVGIRIAKRGYLPFIPHLTHFLEMRAIETTGSLPYEWYLEYDSYWLSECDGLLKIGASPGADREELQAQAEGIRVYRSESELEIDSVE
jgi:hypothetical protein